MLDTGIPVFAGNGLVDAQLRAGMLYHVPPGVMADCARS